MGWYCQFYLKLKAQRESKICTLTQFASVRILTQVYGPPNSVLLTTLLPYPYPNPTFSLLPLATACAFLQTSMILPVKEAWCKFSFSDYFQLFNKTITRVSKCGPKNTQRPGVTKTKTFSLLFCFPGVGLWAFDFPAQFAALTDRNLSAFFRGAPSAERLIRDRGQLGWLHTQLDHRWPGL